VPSIHDIWDDTDNWFRDIDQANSVREVIKTRLADDRVQEECRYLERLVWHTMMGYREVSYSELEKYMSPNKMFILGELFHFVARADHSSIDRWVIHYESELPIIEDKSWTQDQKPS